MYVGTLRLWLTVHAAQSLKDRRRTVQSLVTRMRHTFNCSVADLDEDPTPRSAQIGVVCVSNSPQLADALLRRAVEFAETIHLDIEVTDERIEIVRVE
ncbi:MAG: DUF503 domain-containing protein [Actinobacteria bacterium]|nr:DUF503 domain-containing protein [Actinomycetota bacterium]